MRPTRFPNHGIAALLAILASSVVAALFALHSSPQIPSAPTAEAPLANALDPEETPVQPGMVARYRSSGTNGDPVFQVDPKPSFTWNLSSPHPRLSPGPFEVTWTGVLEVREREPVRFGANLGGAVCIALDGVSVLEGESSDPTTFMSAAAPFERRPGFYRLQIQYRSLSGVPARLQLWWEGKSFGREPVPAWRFKHVVTELPEALKQDQRVDSGRRAAERFGCGRCHREAFPSATDSLPGPSLADLGQRTNRAWLLDWLADPSKVHPGARMPALFATDRAGLVERSLVVDYLLKVAKKAANELTAPPGDHRAGRQAFLGMGCQACHPPPDRETPKDPDRYPLGDLNNRFTPKGLAAFLLDPHQRYADGRMPRFPLDAAAARNLATFLLMWSPTALPEAAGPTVSNEEVAGLTRRLGIRAGEPLGPTLIREKGCAHCHDGLDGKSLRSIPMGRAPQDRGCLSGKTFPRFALEEASRVEIIAYVQVAGREKHPAPFFERQRLLERVGCLRCHSRDSERPAPLEDISRNLWAPFLMRLPYQRTPPLTNPWTKYHRDYLLSAIRDGVSAVRPTWYSFKMPTFGETTEDIARALAEGDGDWPAGAKPQAAVSDPTIATLGPTLAGYEGYSCITCHVWNGAAPAGVEPGAVGPDLTSVSRRLRRDWFDRWLDNPLRIHPGTPMPAIFRPGEPAPVKTLLNADVARQKDALWSYFALGKKAQRPTPKPPIPVPGPDPNRPPLVAQIPLQLPDGSFVESLAVWFDNHDLLLYDLGHMALRGFYTGAQILRKETDWRTFVLTGAAHPEFGEPTSPLTLRSSKGREKPTATLFDGYEVLPEGVRLRYRARFSSAQVAVLETLLEDKRERRLTRNFAYAGVPKEVLAEAGVASSRALPAAQAPAPAARPPGEVLAYQPAEGEEPKNLARPGYGAIVYPRPKTTTGEDRIMPGAVAAHPRDGRLFVASMKLGELFLLRDPHDNGKDATFENFGNGLFQEAYSMLAEEDALYVLHRRNLTRIPLDRPKPERIERVAELPHAIANSYDWGYGLVRDRGGNFVFSFAPHASQKLPGSGGVLRLKPTKEGVELKEAAYGLRNPFGWCSGPDGEVFFTDNQGEWVASNKLCHLVDGRFYGYPNAAQPEHATKPFGKTAVWVPYDWARSLNGVAFDNSGGKFGPFAGQFFLAELMHGGAIVRAQVEKVNGEYQGACFPFWGKGLIGPLTLTFDPRGRLFVGGITQPGWMGKADRGALFRIDYIGTPPFEIQSIHVLPRGFRLCFTARIDRRTAANPASYQIEHYRYEYTASYGSPELDRTRLAIERVEVAADGRSVALIAGPLLKGRIYAISAPGVRSLAGDILSNPTGVYTLNEIPGP